MSAHPSFQPACDICDASELVELKLTGRTKDLGSINVRRVLPAAQRRSVGPFIFFDHMGPDVLAPGKGIDVRPHPHIHLATVTYLFEGELIHRDSLGHEQAIGPGQINWMTAGRGIVHSERSRTSSRTTERRLQGLQLWVGLPTKHEDTPPSFKHYPASTFSWKSHGKADVKVLVGQCYETDSPVETLSPTFFVDVKLPAGASLPVPSHYPERCVYCVSGEVFLGNQHAKAGDMLVLHPPKATSQGEAQLVAEAESRLVLVGGEPLDGPRHIWWNFVSSAQEHIEQAKADWKAGRFPKVPGDDQEFIPLPEG